MQSMSQNLQSSFLYCGFAIDVVVIMTLSLCPLTCQDSVQPVRPTSEGVPITMAGPTLFWACHYDSRSSDSTLFLSEAD